MNGSILVVEDVGPTREVLVHGLRGAGYQVASAVDGEDALRQLERSRFDLIVTDVVMPERDGIELLLHLRRQGDATKVIAMSGALENAELYLSTASQLGANRVIMKPFRAEELFSLVRETLDEPRGPNPTAG
jgi:two-component system response regulator (stage 0 sporulation protein F)